MDTILIIALAATGLTIAATTGYVVAAVALIRVHRQRADTEWGRVVKAWSHVERLQHESAVKRFADSIIGTGSNKPKDGLASIIGMDRDLVADYNAGITERCTDGTCMWKSPHLITMHCQLCDPEITFPHAPHVIIPEPPYVAVAQEVMKGMPPEHTECTDPHCRMADKMHVVAAHVEVCTELACPSYDFEVPHSHPWGRSCP